MLYCLPQFICTLTYTQASQMLLGISHYVYRNLPCDAVKIGRYICVCEILRSDGGEC